MNLPTGLSRRVILGGATAAGVYWLVRAGRVFQTAYSEFSQRYPTSTPQPSDTEPPLQAVTWTIAGNLSQRAYYLESRRGAVIVYAHGSPGSAASHLPEARALAREGIGALLLDLPGYGDSEGGRRWDSEFDATMTAALDFLRQRSEVASDKIGLHGYSMGTYTASRAAAHDKRIAAVALVAPFTNLADQIRHQFRSKVPGMPPVATLAANLWGVPVDDMHTSNALQHIGHRPLLIIAGEHDSIVPLSMVETLAAAHPTATLWVAPNTGHVGFPELGDMYFSTLQRFWTKSLLASA